MIHCFLALLAAAAQAPPAAPAGALAPLAPDALRRDVRFLAADELEGRATSTRGERTAARFVEARFRRLGLEAPAGGYLQPFPAAPLHLDPERTVLVLESGPGLEERYEAGDDFVPHPGGALAPARAPGFAWGDPLEATGPVVFVGYGLHAPEAEYDDFDGVDLDGKVALLLRWEPQADDPGSRFAGLRLLRAARLADKVRACEARGAVAVLAANPPGTGGTDQAPCAHAWPEFSPLFNQLEPLVQARADAAALRRSNQTARDVAHQSFMQVQFGDPLGSSIPVAYVSRRVLERVFRSAGRRAEDWIREVDLSGSADSFETLLTARLAVATRAPEREGCNVLGLWRGGDPGLAGEFVLVGAHLDHVGRSADGEIWNGADDNASGTAALLAVAESLTLDGRRPRRSVACAAFSGEEMGLVGSARLLAQGILPEERIVAMVNLDMVGRAVNRRVSVLGAHSSPVLRPLLERCLQGLELHPDYESEELFERSDQASFYYSWVPVLFFTTGEHPDYHQPTDTWDKLDYATAADIALLARRAVWTLADLQQAPPFEDGYHRIQAVHGHESGRDAGLQIAFDQRLDY